MVFIVAYCRLLILLLDIVNFYYKIISSLKYLFKYLGI